MNKIILSLTLLFTTTYIFAHSSQTIDSLHQVLKTNITDRDKVDTYNKLAEEYRFSDSLKVATYAQKAIQIAQQIDYHEGIADAYYFIGWVTMGKGHHRKAGKLFEKVLSIAKKNTYDKGKTNAYNGLGVNLRRRVRYSEALEYFFKALSIDQKQNDSLGMAIRYGNIAYIMKIQKDYGSALKYSRMALAIEKEIKNNRGIVIRHFIIGSVYKEQGKHKQAIAHYQKSLAISKTIKRRYWQAWNYLDLGKIYYELKKYRKAFEHLDKSLNIFSEMELPIYVGHVSVWLGKTCTAEQNYSKALQYLHKGYQAVEKTGRIDYCKEGAEALAYAYEKLGNLKKAIEYRKLYEFFIDKLNKRNTAKKLAELEVKRDKELTKIAQENALEKERTESFIIMLTIVLLSILGFWFNQKRNNYKLRLTNLQIEQKNKDLKEMNAFRQQMCHLIAHDLKTPLNRMIGLSREAKEGTAQHKVYQYSEQMLHLIVNMLDTQKLEKAELCPDRVPQKTADLLTEAITEVQEIAKIKRVKILSRTKDIGVLADQQLVKRVLVNIFNNAIKHSLPDSDILVQAERIDTEWVKFSITDTGKGIPEHMINKAFDKYFQIPVKGTNQIDYSTGVGLTFCKLVIEAHNGEIGASSSTNLGSTFWFTLPLAANEDSETNAAVMTEEKSLKKSTGTLVLSNEDKNLLEPWLVILAQYQVYQLSKVKAVLQEMSFQKNTALHTWKQELEEALYTSDEDQYNSLIS